MESGENPEQAYPYCNVDEGSDDYSGHWVEEPGKALPEDDAKSGYNIRKNHALGRGTGSYSYLWNRSYSVITRWFLCEH